MKKENEKLNEIYEKVCLPYKINEEVFLILLECLFIKEKNLKDAFNLEKFLNVLDKSDRKKYDLLNFLNYMMSNCKNYFQQLEVNH